MTGVIMPYKSVMPKIDPSVFVAPTATVIGNVTIGEGANIWFNTVLRGDIQSITVGKYTNIQDNSTVHDCGDLDQQSFFGIWQCLYCNSAVCCCLWLAGRDNHPDGNGGESLYNGYDDDDALGGAAV